METETDMKKLAEQWVKAIKNKETPPEIPLPVQHPLWIHLEGIRVLLEREKPLDTEALTQHLAEQMQSLLPSSPQQSLGGGEGNTWKDRGLYLLLALSASMATVLFLQWGMGQVMLTGKEMRLAKHLVDEGFLDSMALCQPPFEKTEQGFCRSSIKTKDGNIIFPTWKFFE